MVWKSNLQPERNLTSSLDVNTRAINDLEADGSDIRAVPRTVDLRINIPDLVSAWLVVGLRVIMSRAYRRELKRASV
jgi:hypothetical protein